MSESERTSSSTKSKQCGQCGPCQLVSDCGKCHFCLDMKKYGGQRKLRKKCLLKHCIRLARKEPEKRQQSQQEPTMDEPQPKRVCFPAAEEDLPHGKTTSAKSATVEKTATQIKALSIAEKVQLITEVENRDLKSKTNLAKEWGISTSSLFAIMANERMVMEQFQSQSVAPDRKRMSQTTTREVKTLPIAEKVKLIKEVENCGSKNKIDIAKEWGIPTSTLYTVIKAKGKVMKQFRCFQVEEAVLTWCKGAHAMNVVVSGQMFQEKAISLAKKLGHPNFKCSDGWLDHFKTRHNITFRVVARAGTAELSEVTENWWETCLHQVLAAYKPRDIFSADETGIFYSLLPDRSLTFKGKAYNVGKRGEQRLTAMVCTNMDGSEKLPLLVIGKSKKPQCFTNVNSLPMQYEANKTAWMTPDIFEAWARNVDKLYQKKKRKIAIIVDKCPAHPRNTDFKSINLVFRPTITTAKLQPMKHGVIQNLKTHYRRLLITSLLVAVDRKEEYNPTVLDAMILLKKAWKMVEETTIAHCFKRADFRKKKATARNTETAEPDADINSATQDKDLFDQLREAGMDIPQEITLKSYAAVDADVRCTMGLADEAILDALSSSIAEVNNVEDENESPTPRSAVSIAEAMQYLDKLQDFAVQNYHTEGMLDAICDIEQVIGRVRKETATQKT
ncbi:tigger transposable element-derived protein 4-like isoform X2 [Patiria miniata]|uniref:Tigger transposable element-derived protein 4 n=1 Tax=Patiria miniata TaxID=46514 RepID=A0A914AZ99_PATMI|nr:tigger transposable element-derived protein 4-like isoform X2 [Patiria miniata]